MPGSVRITAVNGISTVVDLHTVGGSPTQPSVFSDAALTQSVSIPATITADTTFYVPTTGPMTLSVKVAGTEVGPGEIFLSNAGPVGFALDSNARNTDTDRLLHLAAARLGPVAAATTPGTVTGKVEIFTAAGVSAGFLPVYDAIT